MHLPLKLLSLNCPANVITTIQINDYNIDISIYCAIWNAPFVYLLKYFVPHIRCTTCRKHLCDTCDLSRHLTDPCHDRKYNTGEFYLPIPTTQTANVRDGKIVYETSGLKYSPFLNKRNHKYNHT